MALISRKGDSEPFDCAFGNSQDEALHKLKLRYRIDYNAYEFRTMDLNDEAT